MLNKEQNGRNEHSNLERDKQPKRKYQASTVATMTVARTGELGAFLDAETGNTSDDILLHKLQQTKPVKAGDKITVFLYKDPHGRLTASMRTPKMREGQIARLKVINTSRDGAFLDVGAERGIFMPYAGMRGKLQVGEVVWARLYTDKSGRLAMTMKVEDEMRRASRPATDVKIGDTVTGSVYNLTDQGAFMFTDERNIAFMDNHEMTFKPRVGQTLTGRVTFIREDGRINISMRPIKEKAINIDASMLYDVLVQRGGKMPYCDETSSEIIRERFGISKAAFKRALGHLMKERKITQQDGWTYLSSSSSEDK